MVSFVEIPICQTQQNKSSPDCTILHSSMSYLISSRWMGSRFQRRGIPEEKRGVQNTVHVDILCDCHTVSFDPVVLLQCIPHPGTERIRQNEASVPNCKDAIY